MSETYIDGKIREALAKADQSVPAATRELMQMVEKDEVLAAGIVGHHLQNLSMLAIQKYLRRQRQAKNPKKVVRSQKPAAVALDVQSLDSALNQMGDRRPVAGPPAEGSQQHADNIHHIADAFKKPK